MHAVRGFFRFAHIDGLIAADPAVYARLPRVHRDESRTQGLDRLELIRFLQVAPTISVHHGALAYLLGTNAPRASEAAAVRIEDYARHTPRAAPTRQGQQARHHATHRPVLRVLEACRGERTDGRCFGRRQASQSTAATPTGWSPGSPRSRASHGTSVPLTAARRDHQRPRRRGPAPRCADPRPARRPPHHRAPRFAPAATSTATASTSSPPTSPASERRTQDREPGVSSPLRPERRARCV
jgi:integrase/recombinase XerD